MFKNFLPIISLLFLTLLIAGCGVSTKKNTPIAGNGQNNSGEVRGQMADNLQPVSSSELIIGKKITVMGDTNSDGSVTAKQIILGDFMPRFASGTPPQMGTGAGDSVRPIERNNAGVGSGANRQRNQAGNFQAGAEMPRANRQTGGRVSGEILKLENNNLVLKLADGGTKIVFYSVSTQIFILKDQPATPSSTPPTAN